MEKFGAVVFLYLIGSALIHGSCVKLSRIPLIDYHAWGILAGIFIPIDSQQ